MGDFGAQPPVPPGGHRHPGRRGRRDRPGPRGSASIPSMPVTSVSSPAPPLRCSRWRSSCSRAPRGARSATASALWAGCGALAVGVAAAFRPEVLGAAVGAQGPGVEWLDAVAVAAMAVAPLLFGAGTAARHPAAAGRSHGAHRRCALGRRGPRSAGAGRPAVRRGDAGLGGHGRRRRGPRGRGTGRGGDLAGTGRRLHRAWVATAVAVLVGRPHALRPHPVRSGRRGGGNRERLGRRRRASSRRWACWSALVGCSLELARAHEDQTLKLFDSTLEAETADVARAGAGRRPPGPPPRPDQRHHGHRRRRHDPRARVREAVGRRPEHAGPRGRLGHRPAPRPGGSGEQCRHPGLAGRDGGRRGPRPGLAGGPRTRRDARPRRRRLARGDRRSGTPAGGLRLPAGTDDAGDRAR